MSGKRLPRDNRVPDPYIWVLIIVCVLPSFLNLIGISFSTVPEGYKDVLRPPEGTAESRIPMSVFGTGLLIHSLSEWTAVVLALVTVFMALMHFKIKRQLAIPLLVLPFLSSSVVDAFHVLGSVQIISTEAEPQKFVNFSWVVSRYLNVLLLYAGVVLLLDKQFRKKNVNIFILYGINLFFVGAIVLLMFVLTSRKGLPQTYFPNAVLKRPYDLLNLILFGLAGVWLLPRFYKLYPGFFTHALIVSSIPQVLVEAHMAFGHSMLFENNYNIAHFLKIWAYYVPLGGLALDYIKTFHQEKYMLQELSKAQGKLIERTVEVEKANRELEREIAERRKAEERQAQLFEKLERANRELRNFAYIVSHDLKAPLRGISSLATWISNDYADKFDEQGREQMQLLIGRVNRMHNLIEGILQFSRIGRTEEEKIEIDLQPLITDIWETLEPPVNMRLEFGSPLPVIHYEKTHVTQIFQNLLSNAIKFMDKAKGYVQIECTDNKDHWHFVVCDNGPGIDSKHFERIFQIFQTLKPRDEMENTGIGLSIVKKIIENYGGEIWVESELKKGAAFHFTLPKKYIKAFF